MNQDCAPAVEAGEPPDELSRLYREYCRPELGAVLAALRLDVSYRSARGNYLTYWEQGEEVRVLDMLGGYGALVLEHNEPELVALAKRLLDEGVPFHAQGSVRAASARLAERLSELAAGSSGASFVATFANSGAEAVEAAIKHAALELRLRLDEISASVERHLTDLEKRLGPDAPVRIDEKIHLPEDSGFRRRTGSLRELRDEILSANERAFTARPSYLAVEGSFHGKTVGAVQLTANRRYRDPFRGIGPCVRFLGRDDLDDVERAFTEATLRYWDAVPDADRRVSVVAERFANVAACFVEPLQGEGGIRPLGRDYLSELARRCGSRSVPIVIDEIQCGMGRTGRFLYSAKLGIRGDYYLLSKGLGGGLAKISALLVDRRRYRPEFSLLHTSTFAEDELSSSMALGVLDILARNDGELLRECETKGDYLLASLRKVHERYPDVIRDVRGEGLMVGLEFRDQSGSPSNLLRQLSLQGDLVYCIAGYLLRERRVRVCPTLNQDFTLRLEPSLRITSAEIERAVRAIEEVVDLIHHQDTFSLCKYIVGMAAPNRRPHVVSCRRPRLEAASEAGAPRVAFLGHLIEAEHLADYEESLRRMPAQKLDQLLRAIECRLSPALVSTSDVRSRLGNVVNFNFIGLTMTSRRVVELIRAGDLGPLRRRIDEAVEIARGLGCSVIGLGQYSSIITNNGTDLVERDLGVTSGNSLTVAMGVQGLLKAAAESGVTAAESTLGVVGAAGNIASAFASAMSGAVARMVLFCRPGEESSSKCHRTVFRVYRELMDELRARNQDALAGLARSVFETRTAGRLLRANRLDPDVGRELFFGLREELGEDRFVRVASDLHELRECSLVVSATSAAEPFIGPEHLGPGAVVCDLAVPLNTRAEVAGTRPDVRLTRGGIVKLPFGEDLGVKGIPLPPGRVFACMAETMLLGLSGIKGDYSYGDLEKSKVARINELSRTHGFELAP